MSYDWDVSRQVTERILGLSKSSRDKAIALFDSLAANLENAAEASFEDVDGVTHYVVTFGPSAVTYVVDHAVKLAHVVAFE
ncbi:hypothetical protein [Pelagicoccus mobilis]|uniref:Uncharacterized protein n=1 Tax=Pelagicoccus mobilis TaxID=415221 RepID=A0A934RTJ5_9BACT|nr:hypothetical protein [Pelagicoccus mobilis]MBK1876617.1 hypothetical protein [Pelagicoccus mobilis]